MDARDEITVRGEAASGANLDAVKSVFDLIASDGVVAGVEHLITFCHDDLELRPYAATGAGAGDAQDELLRGKDAVLDFFKRRTTGGYSLQVRTKGYDVEGDVVAARGSARVGRPDGSFAETNLSWNFHFRDGLVDEVGWSPRAG
jgi:ketosteroid isomerase-like protein